MANQIQTDPRVQRFLGYPYAVSSTGAPATTDPENHLRDLIMQLLFTNPGERINLPQFGVGVQQFIFAPNGDVLRTTAQFLITTNLQRWLGDRITVNQVSVTSDPGNDATVNIGITYTVNSTQQQQSLQIQV